ncbi:MAG: RNA ligase [bacterium]
MFSLQQAIEIAENKPEFTVKRKNGLVWIDYLFQLPDTFNGIAKNFIGVIFEEETGEILSLPFHKFFNLNQKEEFSFEKFKERKAKIFEKMDGSMVQFFKYKGNLQSSTRMSNETRQSTTGLKLALENKRLKESIEDSIDNGLTPIFELVSPKNQIVVAYPKTKLVYLSSRDRKNGNYNFEEKYEDKSFLFDFEFKEIHSHLEKEHFEGYVCYFEDEILKVKTQWYLQKHKTVDVLMRPTYNLCQIVFDGNMDDFLANAPDEYKEAIQKIYTNVQTDLMNLKKGVADSYKDAIENFHFSPPALENENLKQEKKKQFFYFVEKNYPEYLQYIMNIYAGKEFEPLFQKNLMKKYKKKYKDKIFE